MNGFGTLHSTIFRLLLKEIKNKMKENELYILLYLDYYEATLSGNKGQRTTLHSTIFRLLLYQES